MTTISLFTPINYVRPRSCAEKTLSTLSNYFYLGGTRATVVKGYEVQLENDKVSWKTIALKVASYALLFPLTLTLLVVDLVLRSQYHFTVISPITVISSSKNPQQEFVPVPRERESSITTSRPAFITTAHTLINTPPSNQEPQLLSPVLPLEREPTSTHPPTAIITAQPIEQVQQVERVRQEIIPPPPLKETFHPFTIKVSAKSLPCISSPEEMRLKAQEISQLVLDKHVKLGISVPHYGLERTQAMKFIEELKSVVDVNATRWDDQFYIVPKKTEETQKDLTIRKYNNGVIEEVLSSRESAGEDWWTYWEGQRIYPDGVIETGRFDNFCWHIGTRVEKETTTYRLPRTLVNSYSLDRGLIYADVEGEKKLIVIHKKPDSDEHNYEYVQVEEELIPTLIEILKKEDNVHENSLKEILSGPINCEEFITSLFETNSIFSLKSYPLQILLKIIQEKGLVVNLHQPHPETRETLLDLYSGNAKILKKLLAIDPTLIQRREETEIAFVRALLSGNQKGATLLFNAMEAQQIPLFFRELLFKKVAFSEGEVNLEELKSLSREDQQIIYQLANIYSQLNVIRTLKLLGWGRSEDLLMREGPSIFGCNMDALEMYECLQTFLTGLRSQKLLLTQTEFNHLSSKNYVEKGGDMGRILGRDYIERKAHELGLKHVKVPRKMIVIDDDNTHIKLRTNASLNIRAPKGDITVYAEKIRESNRKITSEEVSELLCLFETTGFSDIHWGNIIVAEDGVYIIDTEFTNFWVAKFYFKNGSQYAEMAKIVHALPIEQQKKLIDELNIKIENYEKNEEELNKQQMLRLKVEQAALKKSGCLYGPYFKFSVNELIS